VRGFPVLLAALALGACKPKDQVTGSAEPPASFGALATTSGCPKLAGAYAWPAVEGSPQGYGEGGIPGIRQGTDFFGSHAQWTGEFRIDEPTDANRQRLSINSTPPGKVSARFLENQHRCSGGWRLLAEYPLPMADERSPNAPATFLRVKIATLANGDLAIGQAQRVDGGKHGVYQWGDSPSGNWLPGKDRVTWYWSRYRRLER